MSSNFTSDAPNLESAPSQPAPAPAQRVLAHPVHTLLLVALLLGNSWLTARVMGGGHHLGNRVDEYIGTIILQLILIGYIWLGLRFRRIPFRELIGQRWKSFEDFALDIAIAAAFWFASALMLGLLKFAFHMADKQSVQQQIKSLQLIAPQTVKELVVFLVVVLIAGVCEEIIFRGYLQKQFAALFRNLPLGIIISALLFGAAHGYQGPKMMVLLGIYGAMFGILAALRKSLIPGMIAHGWQDALSGVGLWFLARHPDLLPFK